MNKITLIIKKAIHIFLLLLLSLWAEAQNSQTGELHLNRLFVKDGMPEGRVTSIVQDKEGYMWIGTQKGLVRYDGYSPKVYNFGLENPSDQNVGGLDLGRDDRLWVVGHKDMLFLYDRAGDRFIVCKQNSSRSDSSSEIISVLQDDQYGHLWLIYYDFVKQKSRLSRFDLATKKFIQYDNEQKGAHYTNTAQFTNLFEGDKGSIWVGSKNGIYRYNEKTDHFDPYLTEVDSAKQNTFYLISDSSRQGILWMAVYETIPPNEGQGLWRYDTKTNTVRVFRHRDDDSFSIASDNVQWINTDSLGSLWITTDKGLSFFDPAKSNFTNYGLKDYNTGKFTPMREMIQDNSENTWLASSRGLIFFNSQTRAFTLYPAREKDPHGLASSDVHDLFIDHSGTFWFGAGQIGLQWINKQLPRFIQYKDDPGQLHHFPGGGVNSFAESKDGTIWLGSGHGLYHWLPHTDAFTFVKTENKKGKDLNVRTVVIDKEGLVWYSVYDDLNPGLYCYEPKTGKTSHFINRKNDSTSLSDNHIIKLLVDHLENIWVGTGAGGLCRFNRQFKNFTRYPYIKNNGDISQTNGALDDQRVLSIYEDHNGILWVGTNHGALNRFNFQTGTFTSYHNLLPGFQCVTSIYSDNKNGLWVGTYYGGVYSFDPQTSLAKKYTEKNGLLYDGAIGILEDNKENLWLASVRGISIFNRTTKQVRNLTGANGLSTENLKCAFKTSNGRFLFGSNEGGFISLNPDDFIPDPYAPVVHIESVNFITPSGGSAKDSNLITYSKDSISFRYNENRLSFRWVGLYYQNPQTIQYAYKLDGYDQDWLPAGTQRLVTYTNLSPGHYTFHVKAANSDGVWNEKGDQFSFTILPPWWLTWWANGLYFLVLAMALWAFMSYRSRNLKRANQALEEKVAQRTIQLNHSIETLKATQSQLIQSEKMASLGELTAGIAHEIQNPLNFINNFSEVNKELLVELKDEIDKGNAGEIKSIADDVISNEEKINHHGKRADAIVKGMLQHSRSSTSIKESTDINSLADEYLRLSYHGLRARDKSFNATMKTDFDLTIGKINIIPQDIGRVLLNLYNNAFYAVAEKAKQKPEGYEPTVSVTTKKVNGKVEIGVKDNGDGIPQKVKDKIFQPFFTTKPAGLGTGLGLSLSYDIVKAHGGEMKVETKEGVFTEFIIQLPVSV